MKNIPNMQPSACAHTLVLAACLLLLSACTGYHAYRKCGREGCPGDPAITARAYSRLAQHPDLGPPNQVYVQTSDRVVFLTGLVATDLQRTTVESVVGEDPQVRMIIDNIAVTNLGGL